ncbi:hypothetical protein [Intrasporangium sp.]|uniref:lipopolysaccharide biosynthesis protein n=1 Tax=Intrasporangium sp. TaxID=1925024 RepID=UPI003221A653
MTGSDRARLIRPVRLDEPTHGSITTRGLLGLTGVASQGLLRFVTNALVGRLAGTVALGIVQSAISLGTLLALMWPTSTGSAASKYLALARGAGDQEQVRAVAGHLSRRTVQAAVVLALSAVPLWMALHGADLVGGLLLAVWVAGFSVYSYTRGVLFGVGQVHRATLWDVASTVTGLAALVVVLATGARGLWLLLPMALSYAAYAAGGWPHGARGGLDRRLRSEIDRFVTVGTMGTLASSGFVQLSVVAATRVASREDTGYYAAALTLATPSSLIAAALSLVLFPTMAEAWGRGDEAAFRRQTDLATRSLVVAMVGVLGVLALLSRLVVQLVWPPDFAPAADLLAVLLAAVLMTTVGVGAVNALNTSTPRGIYVSSGASLLGMLVGVAAWFVLPARLGIMGVAVGYLLGTTLVGGVPLVVVWVTRRHRWTMLAVRFVGAAALVAWAVWWSRSQPAATQLLVTVAFALGWAALSWKDIRTALEVLGLRARRP